jgi:hypothetical protein
MTEQEWAPIEVLLRDCWRGNWSETTGSSYQFALSDYSADQVMGALFKLMLTGKPFLPTPGEIIQALYEDPHRPTWAEIGEAIFDRTPNGALDHPLAAAFDRTFHRALMLAPVHDRDHGHVERARWGAQWDAFVDAHEHRSAHELAQLGVGRRGGDARPLAEALGDEVARLQAANGGEDST